MDDGCGYRETPRCIRSSSEKIDWGEAGVGRLWVTAFYSQNATCWVSIPLSTDSPCSLLTGRLGRGGVSLVSARRGSTEKGLNTR